MVKESGVWQEASLTPALVANFRTRVEATDFDRLNNTVSVTIDNPESGTYTAEVSAYNIPMGPQPYALVVSGMTGNEPTIGEMEINSEQPEAPISTFLSKDHYSQSAESVNACYGTGFDSVYSDQFSFSIQAAAGSVVSVRYPVTGLPEQPAGELVLSRLFGNATSLSFSYAGYENYADGNWWLTDVSGNHISPVSTLNATATYYVVSVLEDGGAYDDDSEAGIIHDPQILGVSKSLSASGATGCTIGLNDDYGPAFLLVIALISLILRRFSMAHPDKVGVKE